MRIVKDGYPLIGGFPVVGCVLGALLAKCCPVTALVCFLLVLVGCVFMLYFFRDPERTPGVGEDEFVSWCGRWSSSRRSGF